MFLLLRIYHAVHLNFGIKRLIERTVFPMLLKLRLFRYECLLWFDTVLLYPMHQLLERYFFHHIVYHYGADYRWNDQRSQNLDKATTNYGYGLVHYALIRSQRPNRVLCIGSMYGFVPYMMARACKENGIGFVDFVDAGFDMNKSKKVHYWGQGFWRFTNAHKHFGYMGVKNHIKTYVMTSAQFAKKYSWNYDYIYLDGDHSLRGVRTNIHHFWSRLNKEGFLCFHDIDYDRIAEGIRFEHGKAWKSLNFLPHKFLLSNHYSGLGFIQKLHGVNTEELLKHLRVAT